MRQEPISLNHFFTQLTSYALLCILYKIRCSREPHWIDSSLVNELKVVACRRLLLLQLLSINSSFLHSFSFSESRMRLWHLRFPRFNYYYVFLLSQNPHEWVLLRVVTTKGNILLNRNSDFLGLIKKILWTFSILNFS